MNTISSAVSNVINLSEEREKRKKSTWFKINIDLIIDNEEVNSLRKRAEALVHWDIFIQIILNELINKHTPKKVNEYFSYLEENNIKWKYLANLIRINKDIKWLIKYIENELSIKRYLHYLQIREWILCVRWDDILRLLHEISTDDEIKSFNSYFSRKWINSENIWVLFFLTDSRSINLFKKYLEDKIFLEWVIYSDF